MKRTKLINNGITLNRNLNPSFVFCDKLVSCIIVSLVLLTIILAIYFEISLNHVSIKTVDLISAFSTPSVFAQESASNDIVYLAKFVCGTIKADEGPLRPGHYDTDISIINKQNQKTAVFWNIIVNDGPTTHSILKKLEHEESFGIHCSDIKERLGVEKDDRTLSEGFVSIHVPTNYDISNPQSIVQTSNNTNPLDVQVFFTANALTELPHEVIYEKIVFYITQDSTGQIPNSMIRKTLDVTVPSKIGEISNTEDKVKQLLSQRYGIADDDINQIVIRIKNVSIGVGAMIDDHAISFQVIKPSRVDN